AALLGNPDYPVILVLRVTMDCPVVKELREMLAFGAILVLRVLGVCKDILDELAKWGDQDPQGLSVIWAEEAQRDSK
ncbi:Hypothetical protein FKW44_008634, partial [Caligus rogercresseyi]